jgi:glutamate-1-semialdehyde 2,1-aminomutase
MRAIAPLGPVYQAGTLSGNPVAVAAGLATLRLVQAAGYYERLTATTRALCAGLASAAQEHGVAFSATSVGGMFGIFFRATPPESFAEVLQCDRESFGRFFHGMLAAGIYLAPSAYEAGFVSSAHGEAEIGRTISAAKKAFADLSS